MKIVCDDCKNTTRKGKCSYCPFFELCKIDEAENRHVQCGDELDHPTEKGGETDA